nr:MAG: wsv166-like protein [Chiromantes dehaani nimavirus]
MIRFYIIPRGAMERSTVDNTAAIIKLLCSHLLSRPKKCPRGEPPTYEQAVLTFFNSGFETLLTKIIPIINPVALLKKVAKYVRTMTRRYLEIDMDEDMKKIPFRYIDHNEQFVGNLNDCPHYSDIVAKLYRGIFSCHNKQAVEQDVNDADQDATEIITDVDLLCVFVAMVALKRTQGDKTPRQTGEQLFNVILESLRTMKTTYKDQWENWPFTRLAGGNKTRDERTFDVLFGLDFRDGRENNWKSVTQAYIEYSVEVSKEWEKETQKSYIKSVYNKNGSDEGNICGENRVYVGRSVYDMFQLLPPETHELLFGKKLANVLRLCYNYSVSNMPYVLASDTHPVIADEFPPIVPSGCIEHLPLLSTNNMTLVSRHAIPSARKLGIYLLNRESSLPLLTSPHKDLGRGVAECMVYSSINDEQATIVCPESEIRCLDEHISQLFMRNTEEEEEHCGLCDRTLNFEPIFEYGANESTFDYFPLHAFMDTYEAVDNNCSASLCPDCVIRFMLLTYEKVSTGGVAISDAFRCPCCNEYMINWLGRGSEVSALCKRLLLSNNSSTEEEKELIDNLMKRVETCFSSLEMLQNDFMNTALSPFDFLPSRESKFFISKSTLRPPVRRYKLTEGSISNRYSLNCVQCVSPLCCDRPDEYLDVETLDVVPALTTPEDDDPNDELDDGPGTHRWPAKLSCGFVSFNAPQDDGKEIETCAQAIALLGRIPKKKRGWYTESPEGKAVVALANWYKKNQPPENMQQLLTAVSSVFKTKDCFCTKVAHHPFVGQDRILGVVSQITVSEDPLVAAYFKLQNKKNYSLIMDYAGSFTRNLVSECLLQMPECVYHRASSFVLNFADPRIINGKRPDEAAKMDYVQSLNITRRNAATEAAAADSISYTPKQERTVEWAVEKGGEQVKTVTCFNCKTPAIKKGGCVIMTCGICQELYCWLCEKPIREEDSFHTITEHGLLYCTSAVTRKAFEEIYNVELATLQLHRLGLMDDDTYLEAYVMEDGFTFDVSTNRASRHEKLQQEPESNEHY